MLYSQVLCNDVFVINIFLEVTSIANFGMIEIEFGDCKLVAMFILV